MCFPAYNDVLHSFHTIADALVSTGLAALGYKYVNIGKYNEISVLNSSRMSYYVLLLKLLAEVLLQSPPSDNVVAYKRIIIFLFFVFTFSILLSISQREKHDYFQRQICKSPPI